MASFTDDPVQLTPYIAQQPVEAMAQVGMRREAEFEKGIQTVQSYYDTLLNLPIAKAEVQAYVKDKVGKLNQAVGQSISGDFSDRRLINQIGSLASQISNDPIVENGVQSTARVQSEIAKQKADSERLLKDGKNAPQNSEYFNSKVNDWLNDGDVTTKFSDSYTPYVDKVDRFLKVFKEAHPDAMLTQGDMDALTRVVNGQVVPNEILAELSKKGIDSRRISNMIDLVESSPDVQAQNRVDGWYRFRGVDQAGMAGLITTGTNAQIKGYEEAVRKLQLEMTTDATSDSDDLNKKITFYKEQIDQLKSKYAETMGKLATDEQGVKTDIVREGFQNDIIGSFAYNDSTSKWIKNPFWEVMNDERNYQLALRKQAYEETKEKTEKLKDLQAPIALTGFVESKEGEAGEDVFFKKKAEVETRYNYTYAKNVNSIAASNGQPLPYKEIDGKYVYNIGPEGYQTQAEVDKAIADVAQAVQLAKTTGVPTGPAATFIKEVDPLADELAGWNSRFAEIEKNYPKEKSDPTVNINEKGIRTYNAAEGQGSANRTNISTKLSPAQEGAKKARNRAFMDAAVSFENKTFALPNYESKEKEYNQTLYSAIVNNFIRASESAGDKTDYGGLADWLEGDKVKDNQYVYRYDHNTETAYIGVLRGDDLREVSIRQSDYLAIPGAKINNDFWNMYGQRLVTTGGATTDPKNTKIASALPVPNSAANNKYIVKQHIFRHGQSGENYFMKVWIGEKTKNGVKQLAPEIGFDFDPLGEGNYNKAQILKIVSDVLANDVSIQGYLKTKNPDYKPAE